MSHKICLPRRTRDGISNERICFEIPVLIEPRRIPSDPPEPPELIDLSILATIATLVESVSGHEGIRDELTETVDRAIVRMAEAMDVDAEVHRAEEQVAA